MTIAINIMQPLAQGMINAITNVVAGNSFHYSLQGLRAPLEAASALDELNESLRPLQDFMKLVSLPLPDEAGPTRSQFRNAFESAVIGLRPHVDIEDSVSQNVLDLLTRNWHELISTLPPARVGSMPFSGPPPSLSKSRHSMLSPIPKAPRLPSSPVDAMHLGIVQAFPYPMGIFILHPDGRIEFTAINQAMREASGYEAHELTGKRLIEHFHPDDRDRFIELQRVVLENRRAHEPHMRVFSSDGHERIVDINIGLINTVEGDTQYGFFGLTDETERYRTQKELEIVMNVIKHSSDPLSMIQIKAGSALPVQIVLSSSGLDEILGYEADEIATLPLLKFFTPESRKRFTRGLRIALGMKFDDMTPEEVALGERGALDLKGIEMRRKGHSKDSPSTVRLDIQALPSRVGDEIYAVASYAKTEERERIEEKLAAALRLELFATMIAGVAHDVNNSLASVLYGIDREMKLINSEGGRKRLAALSALVVMLRDHMFNLGAIAAGETKFTGDGAPADLHDLITEEQIRLFAKSDSVGITIDLTADHSIVMGPKSWLTQAIHNIVINACEAMANSAETEISIRTQSVKLREEDLAAMRGRHIFQRARPGKFVQVSITDTGVGMSDEVILSMYDAFVTNKGTPSQLLARKGNKGLGLWMTHGIVDERDGIMDVESIEGKGTTFHLYFPETVSVQAVKPDKQGRAEDVVLVIDAAPEMRGSMVNMLGYLNYQNVLAVPTLDAGLVMLRGGLAVAVVIVDSDRAPVDGAVARDAIRSERPTLPFMHLARSLPIEQAIDPVDAMEPDYVPPKKVEPDPESDLIDDVGPHGLSLRKPLGMTAMGNQLRELIDAAKTDGDEA